MKRTPLRGIFFLSHLEKKNLLRSKDAGAFLKRNRREDMEKTTEKNKYYVVKERAVPEVLLKVVEAKRLLDSAKVQTVQEASEQTGSAAVLFINIRMIFFPFMIRLGEKQLPSLYKWMTNQDFYLKFFRPLQDTMEIF